MESNSSWESAHAWYDKIVGAEGHTYHQEVILPGALRLLAIEEKSGASLGAALLDVGCGQGVLARHLPAAVKYLGIDVSEALIKAAQRHSNHRFLVADAALPFAREEKFTHAALILALQNMENPLAVLKNIRPHLVPPGKLVIVLNHPCFRIPRQSSWEVDATKNLQYRRIDSYLSSLKIPIQTHPGKEKEQVTLSFHHPLSFYTQCLKDAGFVIEVVEEWASHKQSVGKQAKRENRCRREFPLFLTLSARAIF